MIIILARIISIKNISVMPVRQFERLSDLQTLSSRAQFFSLSNARDEIKASVFDDRAQL